MEEGRLAYRVRTAEAGDAKALKAAIGTTLAHPDQQGRRESYTGAAGRGDILVLERYDRPSHEWHVAGFVECHMRVDDNLSIRDVGTTGDEPQTGVVRYLLDQAFNSFRPAGAQVKIRRDARTWLDILSSIPGFYLEGEEYRRPHYWTIWRWDREHAAEAARQPAAPARQQQPQPQRPRPPQPPTAPGQQQRASGPQGQRAAPGQQQRASGPQGQRALPGEQPRNGQALRRPGPPAGSARPASRPGPARPARPGTAPSGPQQGRSRPPRPPRSSGPNNSQ